MLPWVVSYELVIACFMSTLEMHELRVQYKFKFKLMFALSSL